MKESKCSSYNVFIYVYILVMALLFGWQATHSILKFLDGEVTRRRMRNWGFNVI